MGLLFFWTVSSIILIWIYHGNLKAILAVTYMGKSNLCQQELLYSDANVLMYRSDLSLIPEVVLEGLESVKRIEFIEKDDDDWEHLSELLVKENQCVLLKRQKVKMFQIYVQRKNKLRVKLASDIFKRKLIYWSSNVNFDSALNLRKQIRRLEESGITSKVFYKKNCFY